MTTFLLVRHGYTEWIEKEILHGISDLPLSEFGLKQAELTAQYLKNTKIDRMYSSPLLRTMQTAEKISKTIRRTQISRSRICAKKITAGRKANATGGLMSKNAKRSSLFMWSCAWPSTR